MNERIRTSFRFVGDWPWWAALALALVLGGAAWFLYRRDTRRLSNAFRWLLPTLRALAIALLVFMLCGPVLHHRKVIGQLSKLFLFVDGSKSMGLTDSSMDAGRKILILQRLGMLPEGAASLDLPKAGEALAEAQSLAERARTQPKAPMDQWIAMVRGFAAKVEEARQLNVKAGGDAGRVDAFRRELAEPAAEIARREFKQLDDRNRAIQDLSRLVDAAARWQTEWRQRFDKETAALVAQENSPLQAAFAKFDAMPRAQRLQALLMEGGKETLLAKFGENHDVHLLALVGAEALQLWQPGARDSVMPSSLPKPEGEITNLATGIKNSAAAQTSTGHEAMVLFSDGQHNEGESPLEVAQLLAARGVPLFTVGFGSQVRPHDLAVVTVDGPDSVFFKDNVHGVITLKDDMPPGLPFTITVSDGEKALWQKPLLTEGHGLRKLAFDFSIDDVVQERLKAHQNDVEIAGAPLDLKVSVSQVEGDREPSNNVGHFRFRAVTQKRRILLLDGRPRWETRYIRNMFERDEQWEVSTVIAGATASQNGLLHGSQPDQFPDDPALLQSFDLIFFGDIPRSAFSAGEKSDELQWIQDFVAKRGGAIVFIDGALGHLKEYAGTPLAPLFPVEWKNAGVREGITGLQLSPEAARLAPFALANEKSQNAEVWSHLQPPHWISGASALPGASVLVEAAVGAQKLPAVVYRPFGAGKVLYHAFDDSWRWRYEVADLYHVKYWNQVANWVAELPFAVRDKFVSIDAGGITYRPGESADLRVRLRDGEGRPVTNAAVDAVLSRDGLKIATIRLAPDENAGGLFRGKTASLEPGNYEVAVQSVAIAERDAKARTDFKVEPRATGELTQLDLNEDLLRRMAAATGGEYLREENISRLADLLAPMSQGRVIESDTILWQSYWWFALVVLLLTAEWILRKRAGML